jgi:hypothetical protein
MFVVVAGLVLPGTSGPHTALATPAGMGGVPELKQTIVPTQMGEHPFQAQVFLLKSIS